MMSTLARTLALLCCCLALEASGKSLAKSPKRNTLRRTKRQDSSDLVNTCPSGTVVPIFDKTVIIETFCRCPSGTYGFTCEEGFVNPCTPNAGGHLFPADKFIPANYYLECKDNLPYLRKCPQDLLWNQKIPSCDWPNNDNKNQDNSNNNKPYPYYEPGSSYSYSSSSVQSPKSPNNIASTVLRPSSSSLVKVPPTYFPQVQTASIPKQPVNSPASSAASSSTPSFNQYLPYSGPPQQQPPSSSYDPAKPFVNSCPKGTAQPIWSDGALIATYCQCPDGSYGFTCEEKFANPCSYGSGGQYHPADTRLPSYYFIQCSWNRPVLKRCLNGLRWNNSIQTCDWYYPQEPSAKQYNTAASSSSSSNIQY